MEYHSLRLLFRDCMCVWACVHRICAYALGDLSALFTRPLRNFMQILLFLGCLIQKPLSQSFAILWCSHTIPMCTTRKHTSNRTVQKVTGHPEWCNIAGAVCLTAKLIFTRRIDVWQWNTNEQPKSFNFIRLKINDNSNTQSKRLCWLIPFCTSSFSLSISVFCMPQPSPPPPLCLWPLSFAHSKNFGVSQQNVLFAINFIRFILFVFHRKAKRSLWTNWSVHMHYTFCWGRLQLCVLRCCCLKHKCKAVEEGQENE